MDPYRTPQNTASSSLLPSHDQEDNTDPTFMKAPKRKRLAKVPHSHPLSLVKYLTFIPRLVTLATKASAAVMELVCTTQFHASSTDPIAPLQLPVVTG
jgi:hypothetical protein